MPHFILGFPRFNLQIFFPATNCLRSPTAGQIRNDAQTFEVPRRVDCNHGDAALTLRLSLSTFCGSFSRLSFTDAAWQQIVSSLLEFEYI